MDKTHDFEKFFTYVVKTYGKSNTVFTNLFSVVKETATIIYSFCVEENSDVKPV